MTPAPWVVVLEKDDLFVRGRPRANLPGAELQIALAGERWTTIFLESAEEAGEFIERLRRAWGHP